MGSQSVTCHPAGWDSRLYPLPPPKFDLAIPGVQVWVDLYYVKADRLEIEPASCQSQVQRPTAAPPRNTIVFLAVVQYTN